MFKKSIETHNECSKADLTADLQEEYEFLEHGSIVKDGGNFTTHNVRCISSASIKLISNRICQIKWFISIYCDKIWYSSFFSDDYKHTSHIVR